MNRSTLEMRESPMPHNTDINAWTSSVGLPYNQDNHHQDNHHQDHQDHHLHHQDRHLHHQDHHHHQARTISRGNINYGYTRNNSTVDESAFVSRSKPWLLGYKR